MTPRDDGTTRLHNALRAHLRQEFVAPAAAIVGFADILIEDAGRGLLKDHRADLDRIKAADVNVLFAEKYFASKLSDTIRDATGVEMYSISHISSGEYTPTKFVEEMRENLTTLATAIKESGASG